MFFNNKSNSPLSSKELLNFGPDASFMEKPDVFSSESSNSTSSSIVNKNMNLNTTVSSKKKRIHGFNRNEGKRSSFTSHLSQEAFLEVPCRQNKKRKLQQVSFNKQFTEMFTTKTRIDVSDDEQSDDIVQREKRQKQNRPNI